MDRHDAAVNDSFVNHVMRAQNTNVYKISVESSLAESCGTFGWAACHACFAGMRSVKECLAVLCYPRPDERLEVHFYERRTPTDSLGHLATPLLSEPKRHSENPKPAKSSRIEDSGDGKRPVVRIFWNDMALKFETLPPLLEQPSMTYESLPGYNSDLSSSGSEGPL